MQEEQKPEFTIESIAAVAHEANREYCRSIGDHSQPFWHQCPEWQRKSAIQGVEHRLANPGSTPEESHMNWLALKREDGWQYGEVKDPEKKLHPCMVPFEELPLEHRVKDSLFISTVDALVPLLESVTM